MFGATAHTSRYELPVHFNPLLCLNTLFNLDFKYKYPYIYHQMDLFSTQETNGRTAPLAERMRPSTLDGFIGQGHVAGEGGFLQTYIKNNAPTSLILWGPPGVGKTTLAMIIAGATDSIFHTLSAVSSGKADVRKVLNQAGAVKGGGKKTILFIDEIHRFNKAQQDSLLHAVEQGVVTLIGATTENPSFEVISPLLSRCRVVTLKQFKDEDLDRIVQRALEEDTELSQLAITIEPGARELLVRYSAGDGRRALNTLELAVSLAGSENNVSTVSTEIMKEALQQDVQVYDKKGEYHYDTVSAFIKSMRGSDPDAAVYWLARMLNAGEDPVFIARRMIILASEDIGNCDPLALLLANAAMHSVKAVGMPEARIILAQAAVYLASAEKSNASYTAIESALAAVKKQPGLPVPVHLRNAVTPLMKDMGYGREYKYAHEYTDAFTDQEFLPRELKQQVFYKPSDRGRERTIKERLMRLWPRKKRGGNP